jgi:hypothetical protein
MSIYVSTIALIKNFLVSWSICAYILTRIARTSFDPMLQLDVETPKTSEMHGFVVLLPCMLYCFAISSAVEDPLLTRVASLIEL